MAWASAWSMRSRESLSVQVTRDGQIHEMSFHRGETVTPLKVIGESQQNGTRVKFKPDPEIFPDVAFRYETLLNRLRELAYLNDGVKITLSDAKSGPARRRFISLTACASSSST